MKRYAVMFAILAAFDTARAAEVPQSSRFDRRIQYVDYNAGDVVVVSAAAGLGARIVFSQDETILDVASGFTEGWEFSDRRNILYLKAKSLPGEHGQPALVPEPGKWNTNLMVTTNLRLYDLDLHLVPGVSHGGKVPSRHRVAYRVEFKYPADALAASKALAELGQAQARLDAKPQPRNWNYSMRIGTASDNIAPTMAYDDGRFTYLRFPNNRDFPAAFTVATDKTESLVNSHIDKSMPDTLVLQRVSREMVLRLGNAVVGIYNDSFDADGLPAIEGTTVPGIRRLLKVGEPG